MTPKHIEVMKEHLQTISEDCKLVFPNSNGSYMDIDNIRSRVWKKLLAYAGITKRVRLHDSRGSYVDMVLSSNLSPKFAQQQLGHSKIQTTLSLYAKNNEEMTENAIDTLNTKFEM